MVDLKKRILKGEAVLGTFINLVDNPDIVRILKMAGFDFIVIDNEHGYMDYSKTAAMISVSNALNIAALVRVPEARREVVLKYLEMGASGLLLPCCDNADQAKLLVEYAKYAPEGNRGVAMFRAHTEYKQLDSAVEYMKDANSKVLLVGQIESKTSLENIEAILGIDGIDGVFIGPNDLSQALGIYGQMDNPLLLNAINKVLSAVESIDGKFAGIFQSGDPSRLRYWSSRGMKFNIWGSETAMISIQAKEVIKAIKA